MTAVVLALGNLPPLPPPLSDSVAHSPRFLGDPWEVDGMARIPVSAPVLVIGTGLTMVDFVISLDERGHHGPITALSRHGLLPRSHARTGPPVRWEAAALPRAMAALLAMVRHRVCDEVTQGGDWRQVIDGLRPHVERIWKDLSHDQRRRFLRHLRPWWDVHRHRLAPQIAQRLTTHLASRRLLVHAGHVCAIDAIDQALELAWRPRGQSAVIHLRGAYVVNCAGPASDFHRIRQKLLRELREDGLLRPDPLRLGLDVTDDLRVVDAKGHPSERLFAIGPLTRGHFWEVTAVPEIRRQCEALAQHLARRFGIA